MKHEKHVQHQVGQRIRQFRQFRHRTLQHLAEEIDIDPGFLGQIERGKGMPSMSTLYRSAQSLKVPISELFIPSSETPSKTYLAQELHHFLKSSNQKQRRVILDFLGWMNHR